MSERRMSVIATQEEIILSTNAVFPPIPTRNFDWSAIDANTYDADWDGELERYITSCPQGFGSTEYEAILDLLRQFEEAAE